MRTADEHTKLARAAIDFFPELDSAFEINVSKIRVSLPGDLRDTLQESVERLVKRARIVYDRKEDDKGRGGGGGRTSSSAGGKRDEKVPPTRSSREALEEAAKLAREEDALQKIVKVLKREFPEIARDLGW